MNISDKVYKKIADSILEKIQEGNLPWNKPWNGGEGAAINIATNHSFRGFNAFYLSFMGEKYSTCRFMTYNQAKTLGGQVRKGEHGYIGFKPMTLKSKTRKDENGNPAMFVTYSAVTYFNVDQIDGLPEKYYKLEETEAREFNKIEECEKIVSSMPSKPEVKHEEQRAYYNPRLDCVNMPKPETFNSDEEYYSTLFHELGHSTGHETRINRSLKEGFFGNHAYSEEELVAEFTASFLCGTAGIEKGIIDNSAAYIQGWHKRISDDLTILIKAANKAQKAADFILNRKEKQEVQEPEKQAA